VFNREFAVTEKESSSSVSRCCGVSVYIERFFS